jgi:opine dehydrogenase
MRVAVLGAGNGGVATAFDFAQCGHEVALYDLPEFGANVAAVDRAGGITSRGDLEGFVPIRSAGHDVAGAQRVEPWRALARDHVAGGE